MDANKEKDANGYLIKHKIAELMDNLTSMLFFYRPANPREFLIEKLQLLKASRTTDAKAPMLFTESNMDAVFGILDPTNQKFITVLQYKQAMMTLGIKDINEFPDGAALNKITQESFKAEAMKGLERCAATYKPL